MFVLAALIAPAHAFEPEWGLGVFARTGTFTLSHDASGAFPMLGDPTSILDYAPISAAGVTFALAGETEAGDGFDLAISVPAVTGGQFRDTDYFAGQVLFSDTLSTAALAQVVDARLRFAPAKYGFRLDEGWDVRSYLVAGVQVGRLAARGLDCGAICGALPVIDPHREVIAHQFSGVSGGAGLHFGRAVSDAGYFEMEADLSAGLMRIRDSHHLRSDLGPTPNIVFDFATLSVNGALSYSHKVSETVSIAGSVFGGLTTGGGSITFGARLDPQIGTFPARLYSISGGASLSARFAF